MILLDSSILIELFRKKDKSKTMFFHLSQSYSELSISSISYYEIGIGNREAHFAYWEKLTETIAVLPFDKICSKTAIDIYRDLLSKNKMIDLADLFIGATAVTHSIPIATLNVKHFSRISGLKILE